MIQTKARKQASKAHSERMKKMWEDTNYRKRIIEKQKQLVLYHILARQFTQEFNVFLEGSHCAGGRGSVLLVFTAYIHLLA